MSDPTISTRIFVGDVAPVDGALTAFRADDDVEHPSWPDIAAEAIRAINHLTSHGDPIPAPLVYDALGSLQLAAGRLPQACQQLSDGLQRSLTDLDVYEDDGGDPTDSVRRAHEHFEAAALAAQNLADALAGAQSAIAKQGFR